MNDPNVKEQEVKRMESTALSWPDRARSIVVTDQESYDAAAELVVEIATLEKQIVDHHKPIKETAYAAHRAACAAEKKLLDPLTEAKSVLKRALVAWTQEQERLRREAEAKLLAEQQKADEEAKLALAIEAEAAGAAEETVQEILAAPTVVMPRPVAPPTFQQASGISTSQKWKAEVVNIRDLCRAVADGRVSPELVQPNMTALNGMARAMKSTMNIPGVRAVTDMSMSVRRAS